MSQKELVRAEIIGMDIMARSIYKNPQPLGNTWMGFSKESLEAPNMRSEEYLPKYEECERPDRHTFYDEHLRHSGEFELPVRKGGTRLRKNGNKKTWDAKEQGYQRQLSNVKKMDADLKRLKKDMR